MKKLLLILTLFSLAAAGTMGQAGGQQGRNSAMAAGAERKIYKVGGERHGVSYFPAVQLRNVEYSAGDTLKFDRYHTAEVIYAWLRRWAEKYPEIVELYEAGKSFEGRPIYQITITSRKTGKDVDKPAAFFEGGRHSGEVTASETVLWMAYYLVTNYGKDSEVTRLIDTRAIYLKPVNNPDGHNLYLNTAQSNRSTVRPEDNDGDGLLDEDAPDDIDGDGIILTMRWKDEKNGTMIPDSADSTGRIMKRVAPGKGIYSVSAEGIDNDGDGRINEDGIGGLDLHRNYPENWRPQSERTGRGYVQGGAGEFPLSETETRAVVAFLLTHPNVYVVNSMDTTVPMHLRPPSTSASEERMYPEDLSWYRIFDDLGRKITGYSRAGDVFRDYGGGNPLFGHGPDFGYWYFGSIWYGDEIWNGGRNKDYNNDGNVDQVEMLRWDEEENDGNGFHEWKTARHPVYGEVELGGFNPKFFSQNPPAKHLEKWAENEGMFNIEMVKYLPELAWENIEVKKVKSYKADSADYQLKVTYRNTGKLPTALKQAALVKIVTPDKVVLDISTPQRVEGRQVYRITGPARAGEERGGRGGGFMDFENASRQREIFKNVPFTDGGAVGTAVFEIRVYGTSTVSGKASVYSTRGGVLKGIDFNIK
jgi:hypothetical protein